MTEEKIVEWKQVLIISKAKIEGTKGEYGSLEIQNIGAKYPSKMSFFYGTDAPALEMFNAVKKDGYCDVLFVETESIYNGKPVTYRNVKTITPVEAPANIVSSPSKNVSGENVDWAGKELRMVRMNCLNRATDCFIAHEIEKQDILGLANVMVKWVYDGQVDGGK